MIAWSSNAKYNQPPESGSSFSTKTTKNPVIIHKYVGLGDDLFLTCHSLGMEKVNLHTTNFHEAAQTARSLIRKALSELNKDFEGLLSDEDDLIERH